MIEVRVRLFARYAEVFGAETVEVTVPTRATVAEVTDAMRQIPGGDVLPPVPLVAVNHVQVRPDHRIAPRDDIAFLPPLSGG